MATFKNRSEERRRNSARPQWCRRGRPNSDRHTRACDTPHRRLPKHLGGRGKSSAGAYASLTASAVSVRVCFVVLLHAHRRRPPFIDRLFSPVTGIARAWARDYRQRGKATSRPHTPTVNRNGDGIGFIRRPLVILRLSKCKTTRGLMSPGPRAACIVQRQRRSNNTPPQRCTSPKWTGRAPVCEYSVYASYAHLHKCQRGVVYNREVVSSITRHWEKLQFFYYAFVLAINEPDVWLWKMFHKTLTTRRPTWTKYRYLHNTWFFFYV